MNSFLLTLVVISAPWHFGIKGGWSAGLYGWNAETGTYENPNSHCLVIASRPAILPPGFGRFGFSLEDERSIGYTLDLGIHYKNYYVDAHVENIPYDHIHGVDTMDIDTVIPYVHVQGAGGVQKTLVLGNGRLHIPLGVQLTYNYFIPALTQNLVDTYAEDLTEMLRKDLFSALDWINDPYLIIQYVDEHKMGLRFNFGLMGAIVNSPHFNWLAGVNLDWNVFFGRNRNDIVLYPEFGLSTGFVF
ncbi:hypothetical protein GF359_09955 [candidate division WOR-3 bacterium]|uniref:Outer membrane protein beta-barrel domain-containing protein n=1 Tax=candidate division WOR-3 bacterium TaxID=2052148 RepID=A0A9D5KC95_UNCW3|nr:hypothetical protein [candidate division WOR-3 bacterium]MBD3365524.1 hypothetical protein [candidate division WOR-3 bacterium]